MRLAKRRLGYKNQDIEILGGGAVLVDLNEPNPEPPLAWLVLAMISHDVRCEYPACEQGALRYIMLGRHVPFVCAVHYERLNHSQRNIRRVAVDEITTAMLGEIILTAFGVRHPIDRLMEQMDQPLVIPIKPRRVTTLAVPVPIVFNRPKLGQNPP